MKPSGGTAVMAKQSELRRATEELMILSKRTGVPIMLIGHVTKSGAVAGPKTLEHLVDAVLYFERGAGGFILPKLFGTLGRATGVPQAAFVVLLALTLGSLVWLHLVVSRIKAAEKAMETALASKTANVRKARKPTRQGRRDRR